MTRESVDTKRYMRHHRPERVRDRKRLRDPDVSVIVPAHQCEDILGETLGAILASDLPRNEWELIVVDDASRDGTARVARKYADLVLELPTKPRGPSYARNRGAEMARGDILVFVDSDVVVRRDTLRQLRAAFHGEPDVAAVFGSYDDRPPGPSLVSQYRNLLHHWVHQRNGGEAETFWAGCGAVRREVFFEVGMYDEWHFSRPQIEDIELGCRIRRHGYRLLLEPQIQVTHLKQWSLGDVLSTDLLHRGIPWARLIAHEGLTPITEVLNVDRREKACTALVVAGLTLALGAVVRWDPWISGAAVLALGCAVALNRSFYRLLWRRGGMKLVLTGVALHLTYYLGNAVSFVFGWLAYATFGPPVPPPDVAAFDDLEVPGWPPAPTRPERSTWMVDGNGKREREETAGD